MNEASYRAAYGELTDGDLLRIVEISEENAAHGRKILAERAEAERQAEKGNRIKPGDIVEFKVDYRGSSSHYLVLADTGDVAKALRAHYSEIIDDDELVLVPLDGSSCHSAEPSELRKVAA